MVLLCMTAATVAAVKRYQEQAGASVNSLEERSEPSLDEAKVGNPISHSQLIEISKALQNHAAECSGLELEGDAFRLASLLRGASLYIPPPPPKPRPSSEYQALMARLRADEEARQYERMLNPVPSATQSFYERFPQARQYASDKNEDDELTYQDVDRQLALIINVLVSIVACSVAVWMAARHWRVETRLALAFGSSLLVAVAEVVVYSGYIRRVGEAKTTERKKKERKEIMDTWVIEPKAKEKKEQTLVGEVLGQDPRDQVRLRKGRIKS